jgi:hypothetical protein
MQPARDWYGQHAACTADDVDAKAGEAKHAGGQHQDVGSESTSRDEGLAVADLAQAPGQRRKRESDQRRAVLGVVAGSRAASSFL